MTTDDATRQGQSGDRPAPPGPARAPSLGRHRDFNALWLGQAVSSLGSQVTVLALALTAVLYLHATPFQIGVLTSAETLAFLGPALLFGVVMDRSRKRPLMIAADAGRAAVLTLVPALAWAGLLAMPVMYLVALVHGLLTVAFDLSYLVYLPTLIDRDLLLAGNRRLQATNSVSQVAGPSLGGGLVQLVGAPFALLADAASFVFSLSTLCAIRAREPVPGRAGRAGRAGRLRGVGGEIRSGLRFIYRHPVLRPLTGACATFNFFSQLQLTLIVLYAARVLHMSGGAIGLVFAGFGAGGVAGAALTGRAVQRLGYGPLLIGALSASAVAIACLPFAPGPPALSTAVLAGLYFIAGAGLVSLTIASMTMRQVASPEAMQGTVNASFRFFVSALLPVSALVAGLLGDALGLRNALLVVAVGMPFSLPWIVFSRVRRVRGLDDVRFGGQPDPGRADRQPPTAAP